LLLIARFTLHGEDEVLFSQCLDGSFRHDVIARLEEPAGEPSEQEADGLFFGLFVWECNHYHVVTQLRWVFLSLMHAVWSVMPSPYHVETEDAIVKPTLIILGASARAAATSALRAGFAPWCADLFADADLLRACPVRRIKPAEYPQGLTGAANEAPPGPWLYTGALENRPDIVAKIDRPLLGNPPDVLRRVRSPFLVADVLRAKGLPCPDVRAAAPPHDDCRRWLVKPRRSAGGANIRVWRTGAVFDAKRFYFQEWIDGDSCSAVFVGDAEGRAQLLGVTRQLIGEPWLHAAPFRWCGNIGPLVLPSATEATLQQIGQMLVAEFHLRGLFGIDFILRDGLPWPIEVNPRYPASVEVIERATGQRLMELQCQASLRVNPGGADMIPRGDTVPDIGATSRTSGVNPEARRGLSTLCGKAILFAEQSIEFPTRGPWDAALQMPLEDLDIPFADIPAAGTHIEAGQPICTLFAAGATIAECFTNLQLATRNLEESCWHRPPDMR
jgi:predicted ATP-grasp superfamily ATP-dependent carboligase